MEDAVLNPNDLMSGVALVPAPVQFFSDDPELNDKLSREVGTGRLATLFLPELQQGLLVLAHDDPGIGAAEKVPSILVK
jgi:hypothetical protein